jgi:hypothetical protein
MSSATIKINGFVTLGSADRQNTLILTFRAKRIRLSTALTKSGLNQIADKASFFAINGEKCAKNDWISNGDVVDIFPVATGG